MPPNPRSQERFFQGVCRQVPLDAVSHLHLLHWPDGFITPLQLLLEGGFRGTVCAGRVSLAAPITRAFPQLTVRLSDHPSDHQPANNLLMELPQGREMIREAVTAALAQLAPGGALWLFGAKEGGIRSLEKQLPGAVTPYYKGHLRLVAVPAGSRFPPEATRDAPSLPRDEAGFFRLTTDEGLPMATLPGVFSWETVDAGTRLLLRALQGYDPGPLLLDWGCGNGVVGATMARRHPGLQVVMSDDQWRAVRCARHSAILNGVAERCRVVAEDGIGPQLARERFSTIVSNPPFHRGTATDHAPTRAFIAQAAGALAPGGALWLVGNRFLDYGPLLAEQLAGVEALAGDNRFTVWRGHSRPRR